MHPSSLNNWICHTSYPSETTELALYLTLAEIYKKICPPSNIINFKLSLIFEGVYLKHPWQPPEDTWKFRAQLKTNNKNEFMEEIKTINYPEAT